MKKVKIILIVLTILLLITPVLNVQAKDIHLSQEKISSGHINAMIDMELCDLKSLDGEISVATSTEDASAVIRSVQAKSSNSICMVEGNKIFMISSDQPVTVEVNVELGFSKDGTYVLCLEGNATNEDDEYEAYTVTKSIVVGTASKDDTGNDEQPPENKPETDKKEDNKKDNKEEADNKELLEAIEKVTEIIESDEKLKAQEELFNQLNSAIALLNSKDQEAIDEAAMDLEKAAEELEPEETAEEKEAQQAEDQTESIPSKNAQEEESTENVLEKEPSKAGFNIWLIIIPLLLILIGAAVAFYLIRKKKNAQAEDYDGAPMVEYDIEDDDI